MVGSIYESFITNYPISIIMEFCDNGDLYQKIVAHIKKKKLFKEREIWNVFV